MVGPLCRPIPSKRLASVHSSAQPRGGGFRGLAVGVVRAFFGAGEGCVGGEDIRVSQLNALIHISSGSVQTRFKEQQIYRFGPGRLGRSQPHHTL